MFIHEITDVNKIINCNWCVKFSSMGVSSQEATQQNIINIRLLNTKIYPQNILLDKTTSEMINSSKAVGDTTIQSISSTNLLLSQGPIYRMSIIQGNLNFKIPVILKTELDKSPVLLFKVNKLS